jgi:hypothetical protein
MKTAALLLIACVLFAQKPKPAVPECHSHECHCLKRTQNIQAAVLAKCAADSKTTKEREKCIQDKLPMHCDVAETFHEVEQQREVSEQPGGDVAMKSEMGAACSRACQKHACKCDADFDGQTCFFGMSADDIKSMRGQK